MDLYKNDQFLEVVLKSNKDNSQLWLGYRILDTNISDRWIQLINQNNQLNNTLRYNYRKILSEDEIREKFNAIKSNIDFINENYDRQLLDIISLQYLYDHQHILNDLHEEYETYGDRLDHLIKVRYFSNPTNHPNLFHPVWPGSNHYNNKELHEAFLLLNEQIHNFEIIFRHWDKKDNMLCSCLYDFEPSGLHENLKPEDYFLFSSEYQWGWAYLGYNTLGKHWSSTCNDNDIDVVKRNQVRPQQRFAAETYLNFTLVTDVYHTRIKLYKWWQENQISEFVDPDMKLKDLALGFIPVARLHYYQVSNNNTIRQMIEQWSTKSPSINKSKKIFISDDLDKDTWNKEVWSKYDSVYSVRIVSP